MARGTRKSSGKSLSSGKDSPSVTPSRKRVRASAAGAIGSDTDTAAPLTISSRPKPAAKAAPSPAQRRYLVRGLGQPGGKLSLFDEDGQEVPAQTVESCIARGWAQPWFDNPIKKNWIVARLTAEGYRVLGREPPG